MASPGVFRKLVEENQVARVVRGFEEAIVRSFRSHPMRHATHEATKDRFAICARIFEALRTGPKWSIVRILDQLPEFLRKELDGVPWMPEKRTVWTPDDGAA